MTAVGSPSPTPIRWCRSHSGLQSAERNRDIKTTSTAVYYDPFDAKIAVDPYPTYQRLREEAPVYYNEERDFYALSRFEDLERGLVDRESFISGKGSTYEFVQAVQSGAEVPAVSSSSRILRCTQRTVRLSRGSSHPERSRLWSRRFVIPDDDQAEIRRSQQNGIEGDQTVADVEQLQMVSQVYGDYLDWREANPSDDIRMRMEIVDDVGVRRFLRRDEILTYVLLINGAGRDTTSRLIGWVGKVLAENPIQRRELVEDRALIPNAVDERLRSPSGRPTTWRDM